MEENQTQDAEQVEVEEQEPVLSDVQQELDAIKAALKRQALEYDFYKRGTAEGISNLDKIMPYMDFSKVSEEEGKDTIGDMISILSQVSPQLKKSTPVTLGESSNGSTARVDKTPEMMVKAAGEKARKSGKLEDMAAFSSLKQKLFGGK